MSPRQSWYAQDARAWVCEPPDGSAAEFHRVLPGYAPTPLAEAPGLAAELGVGRLFVKDESARFDLRAFKYLGASWAGFRAVAARTGYTGPATLEGLRSFLALAVPGGDAVRRFGGLTLITATDGNHGRAVARTARLLGLPARVYVPKGVPDGVIDRINAEGALLTVIDGDYDRAVMAARGAAEAAVDAWPGDGAGAGGAATSGAAGGLLIQDTAWEGYEQ